MKKKKNDIAEFTKLYLIKHILREKLAHSVQCQLMIDKYMFINLSLEENFLISYKLLVLSINLFKVHY